MRRRQNRRLNHVCRNVLVCLITQVLQPYDVLIAFKIPNFPIMTAEATLVVSARVRLLGSLFRVSQPTVS